MTSYVAGYPAGQAWRLLRQPIALGNRLQCSSNFHYLDANSVASSFSTGDLTASSSKARVLTFLLCLRQV